MNGTHEYRIRAASEAVRCGVVTVEGIDPSITFSAPPEFKGHAGHWTPEHLLLAAIASCYVSTFSGMAFDSSLEYSALQLETSGTVGRDEAGWSFQEISIQPRLTIANAEQKTLANRLLHKTKDKCLVGRSLACPITLKPALIIEEQPVASHQS